MTDLTNYSDGELLTLLQRGDELSLAAIYDRYWKVLYFAAYNVLQDKMAAEDAVQDVFISLWKRCTEVEIVSLKAYLYQAVRFRVLKCIRAERVGRAFFYRLTRISRQILSEDPLLFKELGQLYEKALRSLPPDEQDIFLLHRDTGLTYKQIAREKDISVKTVEKKMSHAIRQLRHGLDRAIQLLIPFGLLCSWMLQVIPCLS
jgi:RNA polymerase sigma-70 factor (ECF subfamily)